jgi:ribosome biogenesis GTPase A
VLVCVLDARDPMGTRCRGIEKELQQADRRHKHLVFVLNK